ncbi:MAG: hypothetical protein Ct9H300mP13_2730 [Gammaproteobacteria bacterium]|nr:MAG: hypothetical protein Ct9H300mP13_2730 [Gammaproteobacteria bacterium]
MSGGTAHFSRWEKKRYDEVLTLYDTQFRATQTEEYLDMTNAIAMLWRLENRGIDVGNRWEELADPSEPRTQGHLLYFADAHFIMALGRGGRTEAIPGNAHVITASCAA